jgi:hypothetical protein
MIEINNMIKYIKLHDNFTIFPCFYRETLKNIAKFSKLVDFDKYTLTKFQDHSELPSKYRKIKLSRKITESFLSELESLWSLRESIDDFSLEIYRLELKFNNILELRDLFRLLRDLLDNTYDIGISNKKEKHLNKIDSELGRYFIKKTNYFLIPKSDVTYIISDGIETKFYGLYS